MKTITERKVQAIKSWSTRRYTNAPNYYFHPDEDFKEDYEWKNRRMLSKTEQKTEQILLR